MIAVYLWLDSNQLWQAIVQEDPEVNATGGSVDECKNYIVESWNRQNPDDQRVLADFEFVQGPPA
jgi:hypothetical protein